MGEPRLDPLLLKKVQACEGRLGESDRYFKIDSGNVNLISVTLRVLDRFTHALHRSYHVVHHILDGADANDAGLSGRR